MEITYIQAREISLNRSHRSSERGIASSFRRVLLTVSGPAAFLTVSVSGLVAFLTGSDLTSDSTM